MKQPKISENFEVFEFWFDFEIFPIRKFLTQFRFLFWPFRFPLPETHSQKAAFALFFFTPRHADTRRAAQVIFFAPPRPRQTHANDATSPRHLAGIRCLAINAAQTPTAAR